MGGMTALLSEVHEVHEVHEVLSRSMLVDGFDLVPPGLVPVAEWPAAQPGAFPPPRRRVGSGL